MIAALSIVIRTSVLLACVSILSLALRRTSASVRHALWVVGLLAVLVFPFVSRVLPEWNWAILPERVPAANGFDTTPPVAPQIELATAHAPSVAAPLPTPSAAPIPELQSRLPALTPWTWMRWLALIWGTGSLVFLIGWTKSVWDLHRLTQRSSLSTEDELIAQLEQAQLDIGVPGAIPLHLASEAIPPMTWGIFRHVILLPEPARQWSPVRQRLVLAHELAHIKRNDGLGQLLAQAVCCIYWFNPLVWYAVRQLHAERERACDDCVLQLGADSADYADHLLQITRGLNAGFVQTAVSMAHPSQLKTRVIAILDSGMRRSRASRIAATSLLTTVSVLMLTIAAIQLTTLSTLALPAFAAPLGVPFWRAEPVVFPELDPVAFEAQQSAIPAAAGSPQQEFINQYCVSCHNSRDRYFNLDFSDPAADITHVTDNRRLWEKVVRRLRAGVDPVPIAGVARPSEAAISSMIQFLEAELDGDAKTYVPPIGPHRLNRTEYTNAVRDLLDLEFDSLQLLPPDDSTSGFDNIVVALNWPRPNNIYEGIAPIISRLAIQSKQGSPTYQRTFACDPRQSRYDDRTSCARKFVRTLVENAYRGLATDADISDSMAVYSSGLKNGGDNLAMEVALTQILANPKFVYRTEDAPAGTKAGDAFRISDAALASRLSFFLWSTSPDTELIDLAKQGKLHEPDILEQQISRMLKDYRAEALNANFAGQWLRLRQLQNYSPSTGFFPDFDDSLRQAMRREVELFFDSIVREDHSVVELLTADYTFVNNRLAHLYGISNVTGNQFRRVRLGEAFDVRRGILGKAGFLTATNNWTNNNRTSPVVRAHSILTGLLGVDPPPPPPNVPPLKNRWSDSTVVVPSMRTAMEEMFAEIGSPQNRTCISCHKLIDPIGNALENFNPIGAWRSVDGGAPVNAADTLYDGTKVNGPADLRRWLVGRSDMFVQTITERLMTYALGRGVEAQDMPLIRAIDRDAARSNNRFSAIVLGIVKSDTFQMNSK